MPSPADSSKASSLVYRVSGLPVDKSIEEIGHLLARALKISYGDSGLKITSLAVDPYQAARQIATVTFLKIPPALSATGRVHQWRIDLAGEESDPDMGADHTLIFDTHFHGLTPLNQPIGRDEVTDCLVICGLGGHAFGSFKEKGGSYMWLRDSLPKDLQGLRVLLFGYESGLDGSYSNQNVSIIADNLASHIKELSRYGPVLRPLVLIAHSLGGIIAKQAVIKLNRGDQTDKARISSIAGMLFFGVPNRGMDIQSLRSIVGDKPNRYLLESISQSSDFLIEQGFNFERAFPFRDSPIFSFFETQTSPTAVEVNGSWRMAGPRAVLVDRFSATYPRPWDLESYFEGLNRTHSDLVKFSAGDIDYQRVLSVLRDITSKAAALIKLRFLSQESADELSVDEQACLRSLSFTQMHARESNIEPAVKDTGNWLLESADFQDWAQRKRLDQHQGFFLIKGNPGSGKSTLIKRAYADTKANLSDPSSIVTAFFFNARGSKLEKSPTGLFRTLLHSLCQQISALRAVVLSKYLEKSRLLQPGWEWHFGEIRALLESVVTPSILGQRNLVLFIDALDECELAEIKPVIGFFEDLASSAVKEGTKMNICLSSRYWPQLKIRYCFQTQVEVANRRDIETYIHNTMEAPHDQEDDSNRLLQLRSQILENASGIFLWVVLVVQEVLNAQDGGATLRELQDIVQKVPSDLSGLYLHQLQSTKSEGRLPLLRLVQCVFFAQRPLSPTELRYALAFSTETFASYAEWSQSGDYVENDTQMEKRICAISKGLLEIKSVLDLPGTMMIVQFIHESVRDFLQASGFKYLIQPLCPDQIADGHDFMKRTCLNYLKVRELEVIQSVADTLTDLEMEHQIPSLFEDHPLLEYTVDHLFIHAARAEQHGIAQDDFRRLMGGDYHGVFQRWRTLYDLVSSKTNSTLYTPHLEFGSHLQGPEASPLHIFSQYGLLTQDMADAEKNINVPGGRYHYAIHAAAANENIYTVKLLLDTGADPEAADPDGNTAINWAVLRKNTPVLRLFKDNLSLMGLNERLGIMANIRERDCSYEILTLLIPENTIPHEALESICKLALVACVQALSFVLDKCDRSILIEEKLLLSCRDHIGSISAERKVRALLQKAAKIKITSRLLSKLVNKVREGQYLSLLFEKGKFQVDERLIDEICRFSISSQLISQMKAADIDVPPFTSEQILSVLKHGSAESVAFIIQKTDNSLHFDAFLLAAATNWEHGGEVMRLLLGWRPTYRIGDDVAIAAVQNDSQRPILLKVLIDRWDDLVFPVAALKFAVENCDETIVRLIYDRCDCRAITEDLLISRFSVSTEWPQYLTVDGVLEYLLGCDLSLSVSQRLVDKAVSRCKQSTVKLVMERCKSFLITEDLLVKAAENREHAVEILDLLLERGPTLIASESVIEAVFYYADCPKEVMDMFLRRGKPLLFSENIVEAAAWCSPHSRDTVEPLSLILRQVKDATVSPSMIMIATQGLSCNGVISAMLRHDPSINVTEEHLIAAATNQYCGSNIFATLRKNGKIKEPMLPTKSAGAGPAKRRRTLRNRSSTHRSSDVPAQITKKVIKAAVGNSSPWEAHRILALFDSWGFLEEADRKRCYGIVEKREAQESAPWDD